jgi:hypothetical protein
MQTSIFKAVRTIAKDLKGQFRLKIIHTGFRVGQTFTPAEVVSFRAKCSVPGSILVVQGGNTPCLANGLAKVDGLVKFIQNKIWEGKGPLYTSFSAGTVLASATTEIHVDRPPNVNIPPEIPVDHPTFKGLHLANTVNRPHTGGGGKHPRGVWMEGQIQGGHIRDTQGNVVRAPVIYLRDNPQDCYCVLWGRLHASTRIFIPQQAPNPW